jgi:hypothetical protein
LKHKPPVHVWQGLNFYVCVLVKVEYSHSVNVSYKLLSN